MTVPVTAALASFSLALTVFCGWRGARTSRPLSAPRLVPWRFFMLLAFSALVACLVHLAGLLRDPSSLQP